MRRGCGGVGGRSGCGGAGGCGTVGRGVCGVGVVVGWEGGVPRAYGTPAASQACLATQARLPCHTPPSTRPLPSARPRHNSTAKKHTHPPTVAGGGEVVVVGVHPARPRQAGQPVLLPLPHAAKHIVEAAGGGGQRVHGCKKAGECKGGGGGGRGGPRWCVGDCPIPPPTHPPDSASPGAAPHAPT